MRPRKTNADAGGPSFVCACASTRHVARLLTQVYDRHLHAAGIEAPQFALLMALEGLGPTSQRALARHHALDKATVSRNLRVLARRGWIEASPAPDARERRFAVTAAGRRCLTAARPHWRRAQEQVRGWIGEEEWQALFRALGRIAVAAERAASG
jgi:DNA-binding MarR family transcriptional regulator